MRATGNPLPSSGPLLPHQSNNAITEATSDLFDGPAQSRMQSMAKKPWFLERMRQQRRNIA